MLNKKVAIVMGSDSDWPVVKGACSVLKDFGIAYEARVLSAHRTPPQRGLCQKRPLQRVWRDPVCRGHGRPSGRCLCRQHYPAGDRHSMKGGAMDGMDALLATVQMPSGSRWPPWRSTVQERAYLAVAILAVADEELAQKLEQFRADTVAATAKKDAAIRAEPPPCNWGI